MSELLALYDEADKHVVRGGTRRLDKLMKSIELYGTRVIPRVRELLA